MLYLEAILILFAVVDPIGNIPMFMEIGGRVPQEESHIVFNTAIGIGATILLIFTFAGNAILNHVFHINLADLQLAGGILLLIIAIDQLVFGLQKKAVTLNETSTASELGCVPLACPLLAGPGAMATSLTTLEKSGPIHAVIAIVAVFGFLWVIMRFIEPIHKFLGKIVCMVFSKVMCLFIAAIGVHMIMAGISEYMRG
jgi:multiple antibiotic resistance protein